MSHDQSFSVAWLCPKGTGVIYMNEMQKIQNKTNKISITQCA